MARKIFYDFEVFMYDWMVILIDYDTTDVIYLSDYQENTVVDNENNYIIEKEW